nr:hypothetical protein [Tanacetum cinerariifolium]
LDKAIVADLEPDVSDTSMNRGPTEAKKSEYDAFLEALKIAHARYLVDLSTSNESLSASKLEKYEELAVHLSRLLCEETSAIILKIVKAGIEYSFKAAPVCLSFLTCGVIKFAFNLPRAYFSDM